VQPAPGLRLLPQSRDAAGADALTWTRRCATRPGSRPAASCSRCWGRAWSSGVSARANRPQVGDDLPM